MIDYLSKINGVGWKASSWILGPYWIQKDEIHEHEEELLKKIGPLGATLNDSREKTRTYNC